MSITRPVSQVLQDVRSAFHKGDYQQSFELSDSLVRRFPICQEGLYSALRSRAWSLVHLGKREEARQSILEHFSRITNLFCRAHLNAVLCCVHYHRISN